MQTAYRKTGGQWGKSVVDKWKNVMKEWYPRIQQVKQWVEDLKRVTGPEFEKDRTTGKAPEEAVTRQDEKVSPDTVL